MVIEEARSADRRAARAPDRPPRRRRCRNRPARASDVSRGGALTEFAVLTMIMVPMALSIPMIGNLIDLKQTAVQASRYAVWEATVDDGGLPPDNVRARFFGEASAPIASAPSAAGHNALWGAGGAAADGSAGRRVAGDGLPERFDGVSPEGFAIDEDSVAALPYEEAFARAGVASPGTGTAKEVGRAVRRGGEFLADAAEGDWNLTANGLVRGGVRVDIARGDLLRGEAVLPTCAGGALACLEESSVILIDGWSAAGDEAAERRVRSLLPAAAVDHVGNAVSAVGYLPVFKELKRLEDAFGHVEPSLLPASETAVRPLREYEEERP